MSKLEVKSGLKWILPAALLLFHIFFIERLVIYNNKIGLHWACYLVLFVYLLSMGEVKAVFVEFKKEISSLQYLLKVLGVFLAAFAISMLMVYYCAKDLDIMYPLWQPFSAVGLKVWAVFYILLQPLVDNVIYHKWMIGNANTGTSKSMIIIATMLRTFVETGIIIYSKNSQMPKGGFLALACWAAMCIFALSYGMFRNTALIYTSEVLFRTALVLTVFIGMPQYYVPNF